MDWSDDPELGDTCDVVLAELVVETAELDADPLEVRTTYGAQRSTVHVPREPICQSPVQFTQLPWRGWQGQGHNACLRVCMPLYPR